MSDRPSSAQDPADKWEVQLRKGCLELAILAVLWEGKLYGLEILRRLESRFRFGGVGRHRLSAAQPFESVGAGAQRVGGVRWRVIRENIIR